MWLSAYVDSDFSEDAIATAMSLGICVIWLKSVDYAVDFRLLEMRVSRKVIHIFTGPIFVLTWGLYSESGWARFAASTVPFIITLQFSLIGLGIIKDPRAIASMTRRGDPRELLQGPLYYGAMFVLLTIVFWRHSPVGILALMVLCVGDGLAEVIGRRYGRAKLPFSQCKSWAGSTAMFIGSACFGFGFLVMMDSFSNFSPPLKLYQTLGAVLLVSLVATFVEAVSVNEVDNVAITFAALGTGLFCKYKGWWDI